MEDWGLGGSRHRGPGGSGQRGLDSCGDGKMGALDFEERYIWGHRGVMSTGSGGQRGVVSWDWRQLSGGLGISNVGVWKSRGLMGRGQFRVSG